MIGTLCWLHTPSRLPEPPRTLLPSQKGVEAARVSYATACSPRAMCGQGGEHRRKGTRLEAHSEHLRVALPIRYLAPPAYRKGDLSL